MCLCVRVFWISSSLSVDSAHNFTAHKTTYSGKQWKRQQCFIALRQRSNKYWSVYLRVLFPSLTDVNGFSFCSSVKGLLQGYWWVIGLDNSRHNVCFAVMDKWFLKSNGSVSSPLCPCYLVLSVSNMPSTAAVVHEFMRSSCSIFKSLWSWTLQKLPHHFFTFLCHFFFFLLSYIIKGFADMPGNLQEKRTHQSPTLITVFQSWVWLLTWLVSVKVSDWVPTVSQKTKPGSMAAKGSHKSVWVTLSLVSNGEIPGI